MFDGLTLKVLENQKEEQLLVKGGSLNFRIPSNHPVSSVSKLVVLDDRKVIEERVWGGIPQTNP